MQAINIFNIKTWNRNFGTTHLQSLVQHIKNTKTLKIKNDGDLFIDLPQSAKKEATLKGIETEIGYNIPNK